MAATLRATLTGVTQADRVIEWPGRLGKLMRPLTEREARRMIAMASWLFVGAAVANVPLAWQWVEVAGVNQRFFQLNTLTLLALALSIGALLRLPDRLFLRLVPLMTVSGFAAATWTASASVVAAGPRLGVIAAYYVATPLFAFMVFRQHWAAVVAFGTGLAYAAALLLVDDAAAPAQQWIVVATSVLAVAVLIGGFANHLEVFNQRLGERVSQQVDELERTGRLKRFLPPQVAELVTAPSSEVLAPHRSDVAVFFVDLRGFSQYTNYVSAEDVVRVLTDYYETVGAVLQKHGATVGALDGDGMMAYIGDPVPRDDAPEAAIAMARDVACALDARIGAWTAGDQSLGYGIGLAYGPATLGVMGFEGLSAYTAVGAVVNLAARLCAEAKHREIVVDSSFKHAVRRDGSLRRRGDVDLKGFGVTETFGVDH